jgi:hypothetical protein
MSLYYVQTERGAAPMPDDGIEYPDIAMARIAIARTAAARLCDRISDGTAEVSLHVTDDTGRELFTATATVAVSPLA